MVDINQRVRLSTVPDRRTLASLTTDPKLIKYLENLGLDVSQGGENDFEVLLSLIIDAAEQAFSAQGTANSVKQAIEELGLAIQALDIPGAILQRLGAGPDELSNLVQSPDQEIQRLQRKVDELEGLLLENRPPIVQAFAPTLVTVTSAYSVPASPPAQPLTVRANAAAGGFTVTLPANPVLLQQVNIKKVDASANVVTISAGASTIDGSASIGIASQYTNMKIQFNGATWDVL